MPYVDGFVIPIPKKHLRLYRSIAARAGKVWMKCGALEYRECTGDDLNVKGMGATFPKQMKAKKGETVLFSWIVYRTRGHRDSVNKKVMKDPWMKKQMERTKLMPFDVKRMLYGGFKVIVDL